MSHFNSPNNPPWARPNEFTAVQNQPQQHMINPNLLQYNPQNVGGAQQQVYQAQMAIQKQALMSMQQFFNTTQQINNPAVSGISVTNVDVTKMPVDHDGLEPIRGKIPRVDQGQNCSDHIVATTPINDTFENFKNEYTLHIRAKEEQMTALKVKVDEVHALLLAKEEQVTALKVQVNEAHALLLAKEEQITKLKNKIKIITDCVQQNGDNS